MHHYNAAIVVVLALTAGCSSESRSSEPEEPADSKKAKRRKTAPVAEPDLAAGALLEQGESLFDAWEPHRRGEFGPVGAAEHSSVEPDTFSAGWAGREAHKVLRAAIDKDLEHTSVKDAGMKCSVFHEGDRKVRRMVVFRADHNDEYAFSTAGHAIFALRAHKNMDQERQLALFHRGDRLMRYQQYWGARADTAPSAAPAGFREGLLSDVRSCLQAFGASNPLPLGDNAVPMSPASPPSASHFEPIPNTSVAYEIVALHSGMCLEVQGAAADNGIPIVQAPCSQKPEQRFSMTTRGDKVFIVNQSSGKCVDVRGASLDNAATIQQWACVDVPQQTFSMQTMTEAQFRLTAAHSSRCLSIASSSADTQAFVQQQDCTSGKNQQFGFRRVQ